jgi:exosortase A-associated hydrolase 2
VSVSSPDRAALLATPFFFGASDSPLFGYYTPPAVKARTDFGFVFCPPVGPEYFQSHRAMRLLATRLSELGFAVLRFDYRGCGDSAGLSEECRLEEWLADIAIAVKEIRRRGVVRIGLVGLRLGAALALLGAEQLGGIEGLVLWDPVLDGRSYVDDLAAEQRTLLQGMGAKTSFASDEHIEVLGFTLRDDLRQDLASIDLKRAAGRVAGECLIIESGPLPRTGPLAAALEKQGVAVAVRHLPGQACWVYQPGGALVPHRILQEIVKWSGETFA